MAHARTADGDDSIQGINVTPLVDIMLVLIIIFMVASQIGKVLDLELHLPKAASAETAPPPTLTIEVIGRGQFRLDGKSITLDQLQAAVHTAAAQSAQAQALIAGDEGVPYDAVVSAVDAVRMGGITQLGLAVRGPEGHGS